MFLQHAKLPVGLTFTHQTPSDLRLHSFWHFLFEPVTLWVSLQLCCLPLVSNLYAIHLPIFVGGNGCLAGLFRTNLLFSLLWPDLYLDCSWKWFNLQRNLVALYGQNCFHFLFAISYVTFHIYMLCRTSLMYVKNFIASSFSQNEACLLADWRKGLFTVWDTFLQKWSWCLQICICQQLSTQIKIKVLNFGL